MVDAIEAEWRYVRDAERRRLLQQAHEVIAKLAELEEGDL
jgi:hypothetical protein